MNVTQNNVYTMYKVLYKIKQLSDKILKRKVKSVNKSQCCRLVKQAAAGSRCGKQQLYRW